MRDESRENQIEYEREAIRQNAIELVGIVEKFLLDVPDPKLVLSKAIDKLNKTMIFK